MFAEKFKTQFRKPERFETAIGSRFRTTFGVSYDDEGRIQLEEKGRENLYEMIQSHKDSVDIHVLLKRFENGDVDALSRVQGFYGDFSGLPVNYAQLLNTVNDAHSLFDSLPVDIRGRFGHDFNDFMMHLCEGTLMEALGFSKDDPNHSPSDPNPSPSDPV